MAQAIEFKHNGATYRVHELTVIQVDLRRKVAADIKEAWIQKHESTWETAPRRLDTLILAYVDYMFSTDIDGKPPFPKSNPALLNGEAVDAYDTWEAVIMDDRGLQVKWDTAIKEANKALTDPQPSSGAPSGESKSDAT